MIRLAAMAVLVACGGGAKKPAGPPPTPYTSDVDQVLATAPEARTVEAPTDLRIKPWAVGQWALYKVTDKSGPGYMRYRAVREDTCGMWFEQTIANKQQKLVVSLCVKTPPDLATTSQATVQMNANPPYPIPPPKDIALPGAGWEKAATAPREDVAVPAGTFAQTVKTTSAIKKVDTTVWSHPAIPLAGTVKAVAANGVTTELLDFGDR